MAQDDAIKTKAQQLRDKLAEAEELQAKMESDPEMDTDENRTALTGLIDNVKSLRTAVERQNELASLKAFSEAPVAEAKSAGVHNTYAPAIVTPREAPQTPGQAFVDSESYKKWRGKSLPRGLSLNVELPTSGKATVTTAALGGIATDVNYVGSPLLIDRQRLTIRDLLAQGQTDGNQVSYIKETSYTNAATTVAEGGLKPEASFALEDAVAPVKKIAVIGRVTDEMWNDYSQLRSYIDARLRLMVSETEEAQLLNGDGTGANLTGILSTAGIQTQAKGTDAVVEAIYKAITKIRVTGHMEPTGMVVHPNDWQDLRLTKDGNDQYYGGGPFTGAYGNNGMAPDSLWGMPAVITTAIAEGTALVGAFKLGAQVFQREGITVETTNSDGEDFRYNRIAIRVEERLALAVYRPAAFCTVTGI